MKLLKCAVITTTLALSFEPALVNADICLGMACMYNRMTASEGIDATLVQINESLNAIQARVNGDSADSKAASDEVIIENIKDALKLSKEINANDKVDNARAKANRKLKSAMSHAKESALQEAEAELRDAKKDFEALKSLI